MKKERKQKRIYIKVARLESTINIEKSTSGGIFGELARKVLSEEGIVYGAVFEKDYKSVHHVRCDNLEKLQPILKSKYVKSNLENTFKEAKNDLDNNKTVLYSGTPCQIAALKQFLKKEYDNLLTVDIVCHGTPIPKIWKNYASYLEKEEGSRIKHVDFRYFNPEDPSKNLYIEFENGTVMNEALYDNSYGRAFSIGLINLEACGHCQFKDFANKSDITLGDAWGYNNKMYPYKNSLIFINNEKGKKYYDSIKKKLIEFHDFNFKEMLPSCYPILHPTLNHYNQGKVNANARNMDKELWYWLDEMNGLYKDKKAVGILNFSYENINFGANLVPYSLSEVLKKLGYHPWNIDFDVFKDLDTIKKYQSLNFYYFREKYLNMTPKFKKSEELTVLNKYFDMFITGSDQVFRKLITKDNYSTYFLDFVKNKNKISYGASFGSDKYDGDMTDQAAAISDLSSFYAISIREKAGIDICKEKLERDDAELVLDPTLLLDAKDYEKINDEHYDEPIDVAVYLMLDQSNKKFYDREFKRLFGNKKIINIKGDYATRPFGDVFVYNHISKWIDGIRKAKYIVTDSYHGLIFGLIHHKNIICIGNKSSSYSRFATLIEILGGNIDKVMFSSLKEVKSIRSITNVLNYDEIDKNIAKYRKKSINFLKENLDPKKVKEGNEFYKEVSTYLYKIQKENETLKDKQNELNDILNSKSWKVTQPLRYARRIVNRNNK